MDNTFKRNLSTLKESILDEEKLVTYISLSKELCIHVNAAKDLLNHVVKDIRKMEPKPDISVCYMVSGVLSNSKNSACTSVCCETDLEKLRKTLNIIFYEHVYCVSKGVQAVDNVALTAINKFEDLPLCTGLIKTNLCSKRAESETLSLKSKLKHTIINGSDPNAMTKSTKEKKSDILKNGTDHIKKGVEVKSETVKKSETPSPKKESINNKTNNKNGTKTASKSIAGFFNKGNGSTTKAKDLKVKEDKQQENKIESKVEKEIKLKQPEAEEKISVKTINEEPVQKSKKVVEKEKPSNKSLKQIKKNAKVDKKRKRVLHVSDSESDNELNDPFADDNVKMSVDHESEDEIPPTPTVNTVKITSGIINPRKRRKIVDKTYTDEDGYILTKKEEVYESCSDNEGEIKEDIKQEKENVKVTQAKAETSPKKDVKIKKRKTSPPQKGKQQTLTNFFKKV